MPTTTTLEFIPETHTYRLDGAEIPGVSKIIAFAGLSDMTWVSEEALKRGSYVHQALEFEDLGDLNEADLDEKLKGYLKAWRTFKADFKAEIHCVEQKVHHPIYRYGGTLDRIAKIEGHFCVIDIKSGSPAAWHPIQTALYSMTQDAPHGPGCPRRAAVYVTPEGKYRFITHNNREDFTVAKAAITLAQWKERNQ